MRSLVKEEPDWRTSIVAGDRTGMVSGPLRLRRGSRFTWRKECQSIMERSAVAGNKRPFCVRFFQVEDEPLGWLLPLSCSQSAKNKRSNQLNFNTAVFLFFFRLSPSTWNHPSASDSFLCSTQYASQYFWPSRKNHDSSVWYSFLLLYLPCTGPSSPIEAYTHI